MSIERVNEVPFTLRRRQRTRLGQYWATMGFIFQILRDIHPQLKILIDTMTLLGIIWSVRTGLSLFLTLVSGKFKRDDDKLSPFPIRGRGAIYSWDLMKSICPVPVCLEKVLLE